nr:MAG TPA: hypothetical protein [Caudoviricetes sp.]
MKIHFRTSFQAEYITKKREKRWKIEKNWKTRH